MKPRDWFSTKFADERVRYILVGAINTLFGFLLFTGLYYLLIETLNYIGIFVLTQVIAITFSHFMQRNFVWRTKNRYSKELVKFASTYVTLSAVNIVLLAFAVEYVKLPTLSSQYAIGFLLIIVTFFFQKYWIFKKA